MKAMILVLLLIVVASITLAVKVATKPVKIQISYPEEPNPDTMTQKFQQYNMERSWRKVGGKIYFNL